MGLATIQVFPEKVRFPLNEEMYGVFYEEINHAGDGGLYAELIRNRSFMDARLPEGTAWYKGSFGRFAGMACTHDGSGACTNYRKYGRSAQSNSSQSALFDCGRDIGRQCGTSQ